MSLTQIQQAMLQDGILTADAAGRLKMADGFVNNAKMAAGAAKANWGAGGILQVVQAITQSAMSTTSQTRVSSGFSVSITPSSATSKILILFHTYGCYCPPSTQMLTYLYRNGSNCIPSDKSIFETETGSVGISPSQGCNYLDSPSSTSALTYTMYFRSSNGNSVYLMNNGPDYGIATLTAIEVAA